MNYFSHNAKQAGIPVKPAPLFKDARMPRKSEKLVREIRASVDANRNGTNSPKGN